MTITVTEEIEPIYSLYMPAGKDGWRKAYHVGRYNTVVQESSPWGYLNLMIYPDCKPLGNILDVYRPKPCDILF